MMPPPAWLTEQQRVFSLLLRTPLVSTTGTFCSDPRQYPSELPLSLASASPGTEQVQLALYHEQYWMRLFTLMQERYPRLAFAMGYWHFNHLTAGYLNANPPGHFDIDRCADGFGPAVSRAIAQLAKKRRAPSDTWGNHLTECRAPRALLQQALRMDALERRAFEAELAPRWAPTPEELARLSLSRVRFSDAFGLVHETWNLIGRSSLVSTSVQSAEQLQHPTQLLTARYWVFYRTPSGVGTEAVPNEFADLLSLCQQKPFGTALEALESRCTESQLVVVQSQLQAWIRRALDLRLWVGLYG